MNKGGLISQLKEHDFNPSKQTAGTTFKEIGDFLEQAFESRISPNHRPPFTDNQDGEGVHWIYDADDRFVGAFGDALWKELTGNKEEK